MEHVDLYLGGGELDEGVGEGLDGAVDVALDDDVELLERAESLTARDVVEGEALGGAQTQLALQLLALVGDLAGFLLGVEHGEGITCGGGAVKTEDQRGLGGTGLFDALVALVEHGLDLAVMRTGEDDVALTERTVLHQHGGHVTASLVERRLDDRACGVAVGVGLEFEQLGFEEHLVEQLLHAQTLLGRDILALVFAAPFLHEVVHLGELLLDLVGVGGGFVYLVDRENDGHTCGGGVVDGLHGLRHHIVVGGHDDDTEVGDFGASGTHGGEGLVARGVEEGDVAAVAESHMVGADVLGDAAGLACDHVGLADVVEERGLTVVHMAHDGHDRRTGHEVFLLVLLLGDGLHHLSGDEFRLEAEFLGHDIDGLGVEALVDGYHHTEIHAGADNLGDGHIHHRGEVVGRNEFGELEHLRFGGLGCGGFAFTLGHSLALLLAPLHALLLPLVLGGEAGEHLLYLLLHILLVDLGVLRSATAVAAGIVAAAAVAATATLAVVIATATVAAAVGILVVLLGGLLDVDFLLRADAFAFLASFATLCVATLVLAGFGNAFVTPLLFCFLFGAGSLVDGGKVDFADDVDCRTILGESQREHFGFFSFGFCFQL